MLFNDPKMQSMREKFASLPNYDVPNIVYLDRSADLAPERSMLEQYIGEAPEVQQKQWLSRIINKDRNQHLGAWFEIMLYGWLTGIGIVEITPELGVKTPDFLLTVNNRSIVVEATARGIDEKEYRGIRDFAMVNDVLKGITKPNLVSLRILSLGRKINRRKLLQDVNNWLDMSEPELHFTDQQHGTSLVLWNEGVFEIERLALISAACEARLVSSKPLKTKINKKLRAYKNLLQTQNNPFIVAILAEDTLLTSEDVVNACFGKPIYKVLDIDKGVFSAPFLDRTGLLFNEGSVVHRALSGVLVFSRMYNKIGGFHELRASYIQNPWATHPVDLSLFPVESRFVDVSRTSDSIQMAWHPARDTL